MANNSLNPTGIKHIGDPYVLHCSDGKYYMYATTFEPLEKQEGFNVWVSNDLSKWELIAQAYIMNERSFGYKDFWAPEVKEYNGKFYMHYSARCKKTDSLRIGVAVSESPIGPFIDVFDKEPMFDFGYAAIDGHVFIDDDGKKYFFYSRDCSENVVGGAHESHIYVADMDESLTKITNPRLVFGPEKDYEKIDSPIGEFYWNEGPFMIKNNGLYYLFFSANFFASKDYCTCYAVSEFVDKGFIKSSKPLLKYVEGKISGPGHISSFIDNDNNIYLAYHVHTYLNCPNHDRQMFIDKIHFENNELICDGPTIKE